jgi:predicted transcriptional regulator
MAVELNDEGTILGWYMVDLDDDGPKRLYHLAEKLGLNVERLIDEAMREKADRMEFEIKKHQAGRI